MRHSRLLLMPAKCMKGMHLQRFKAYGRASSFRIQDAHTLTILAGVAAPFRWSP